VFGRCATLHPKGAEEMVTQIRMQVDRARSNAAAGSTKPSATRQSAQEPHDSIVLRPSRANDPYGYQDASGYAPPRRRSLGRDLLLTAAFAIGVVVAYPSIEPHLPYSWRTNIASVMNRFAPAPSLPVQGAAVVVSDLNLRKGPSTSSAVVALLPRGSSVATIEKRGDWMFVQLEADNRAEPRRGWVYGSFLKDIEVDDPESSDEAD
jgi:hypothetical protein